MRKVIGDYLLQFQDMGVSHTNHKDNKKALVIVDDRRDFFVPLLLKNYAHFLDDTWNFYYFVADTNVGWVQEQSKNINIEVIEQHINTFIPDTPRITVQKYNDLATSHAFWEYMSKYDRVLTAEFDSCLFNQLEDRFLEYDIIGAPCGDGTVYNGGLCLRNPKVMLKIIKKHKYVGGNEDVYFSQYLKSVKAKVPDTQTAVQFSVESYASQVPFGMHGTDKYYIQDEILQQFYVPMTKKKPLLFVSSPIYKLPAHPKFMESLQRIQNDPRFDVEFRAVVGDAHIERARSMTLLQYLQRDRPYDWYVAIDSDIEFNADILWGLINSGKDVVGAAYAFKADEGNPKHKQPVIRIIPGETVTNGLQKVQYLGGGFTLVRDNVIRKLCDHYRDLKFTMNPDLLNQGGKTADTYALWNPILVPQPDWGVDESGKPRLEMLSEDYSFCQRILDMGEEIWLDHRAYIAHWTRTMTEDGKIVDTCYQLNPPNTPKAEETKDA